MHLSIPDLSFVVLIGPAGSGKSTFASRHFRPTEVLSSDGYRALVSDDGNDETATEAAFEVLYHVARKRFAAGRLAVLDATNVNLGSRKKAVALAREYERLPLAIVFDLPEAVCHARNRRRAERNLEEHLVREQIRLMHRAIPDLEKEGFRQVYRLTSVEEVEAVTVVRGPLER